MNEAPVSIATPAVALSAESSERLDQGPDPRNRGRRIVSVSIALADLVGAAALVWRAVFWPGALDHPAFIIAARIAAAALFGAWGLVYLAWILRPAAASEAVVRAANARAGILIAAWSAAAGTADLLAGAGPVALVCGLAIASLYGWDRPLRSAVAALFACALCAAASIVASSVGGRVLDLESLALIAVSTGFSAAISFTIKSYVAPGRELLRSLETENRQLWDLSFRDPLTGLYNRRFAQETGRILFMRAKRYREQLYVLMIDVDRFKRVNDELTHARGDEVLKAIAAIIQACLRSSDSVSRYGGEEFLVFLVQSDSQVAQFVANRIRESIESTAFVGVPWQVTISVGVAGIRDDDKLESLIDRADRFLYTAKRGGRNRVSGF